MAHTSSFVLILLLCGIYLNIVGCNSATKSGPFVSTLVRAERCTNPTQPYQKDKSGDVSFQLYKMGKKTLVRGNYTSYKPDSGVKVCDPEPKARAINIRSEAFFITARDKYNILSRPGQEVEICAREVCVGPRTMKGTVPVIIFTLRVEDRFLVNDKWQLSFIIEGMSCHGRITAIITDMFGIKFNKKTCSAPKGVYAFNNIDYDFVDHLFFINREYGRVLRKVEAFSKKGTMVCLEFEAVVTPKDK